MNVAIRTLIACSCFLLNGCEQGRTGASDVAISIANISRMEYATFFLKKPPWQYHELRVSRELEEAMTLAEEHFRSVRPELLISGNRMYGDDERDLVYLTFDHAIPASKASDPAPPPRISDFYVVYIYNPSEKRFLGYAQHPGG